MRILRLFVEYLLLGWILAILFFYALLYPTPFFLSVTDKLNLTPYAQSLYESIHKYFITTDYSEYSTFSDPLWKDLQYNK